jgi:hypothetical protein
MFLKIKFARKFLQRGVEGRKIRKTNGGEYDQTKLYAYIELSQ